MIQSIIVVTFLVESFDPVPTYLSFTSIFICKVSVLALSTYARVAFQTFPVFTVAFDATAIFEVISSLAREA